MKPLKPLSTKPCFLLMFIAVIFLTSCEKKDKPHTHLSDRSLIPVPAQVHEMDGTFEISKNTILYTDGNKELDKVAQQFINDFKGLGNLELKTASLAEGIDNGIVFKLSQQIDTEEGYTLKVTDHQIQLEAKNPEGIFRGSQTILQLLPAKQTEGWLVPAVEIEDFPQYAYRGAMLDVARHFFSVNDVKRYIDLMAAYKFNVLHLHLTDDQGWRIEIKSWPKLTEIGGSTEVGGEKGGFYTQEEYQDIVKYAAEKYITIIPEIDMPGHTNAALASYPELNCNGKATELYTGTEVGFSSFCTDKEITYKFIDDVIKELVALTPGPYIHIGGDESHSTELEDYIPFVNRVQDIVYKYGKTPIGWDEIRHAKLKNTSVVQFWANKENALAAVQQGAKVLMSPASKAYVDMKYDSITPLGLSWAGIINVKTAYNWDPATLVDGIGKPEIVGIEAPLWTETLSKIEDVEYMAYPRLLGYAEIGWSQDSLRYWDSYKKRLSMQYQYLKQKNINFYESKLIPWYKATVDSTAHKH
ncbi:beta-N-acetylhexosaminidase [Galbibacter sp. PAP.153]|uniref:beta-N-acetylhexosaminidase n=1 Tax=Galbibacter sp. PAP.153 TaxID=3104623 RepID=UPI00300B3BF5